MNFYVDDLSVGWEAPAARMRRGEGYAGMLRRELNARALEYARRHRLVHETTGDAVVFGVGEDGSHGNFFPSSYTAICGEAGWQARLGKAHTAHRRVRARADWAWRELDTASSSDALLMNIMCCPGVLERASVRALLGVAGEGAVFGYRPGIPLIGGKVDRTEVDLRVGSLLVEAKLTEGGFQGAREGLVARYRDVEEVFGGVVLEGYQLVRGVLAAYAEGGSFCLLADARRPDLVEGWYGVLQQVRLHELRCRLQMLTWQEMAGVLPKGLREFLDEKYGIVAG